MKLLALNISLSAFCSVGVALCYSVIADQETYGYAPMWEYEDHRRSFFRQIKAEDPGLKQAYRLSIQPFFYADLYSIEVIGGAEPKLRYSEFAGFDYQSPQTISVERKLSPRLFDEFLRELYQTGIIDEEPCCSAAFDGIYSGLEVWSHGKYLAYSSNVPELAIGEIARVFLELCASTCNSQPSYIADNFVPHDH